MLPSSRPDAMPRAWIGFLTLLDREVKRYLKLSVQTIGAPFLANILFLAVFGSLLTARSSGIEGVPYVRVLIPGLVLMGAITSAFQNPLFSLVSMKYQNTLTDLGQYPLSASSRLLAFSLAGALRGVLVAAMTFAAAGLFHGFEMGRPVLFWLFVAAVSFVAAAGGVAAGLHLDTFEKANLFVSLVLVPSLYLGGVFSAVDGASRWLALVARYDPLTFLVGQARRFYLGGGAVEAPVTILLSAALGVASVGLAVSATASGRGMKIE
jgi:ABC-2 type transport system permease protein